MKKDTSDYAYSLLAVLISCLAVYGLKSNFENLNEQGWVAVFFLGTFAAVFLMMNLHLVHKYRKRARYIYLFEDLNLGYTKIHEINRAGNMSSSEIISRLQALCNSISRSFSVINGHHIGVSIKLISSDDKEGERGKVFTVARDKKSRTKNREHYNTNNHYIDNNTDFLSLEPIDNSKSAYYYGTKLPIRLDYKSSRLPNDFGQNTSRSIPLIRNYYRRKSWPLDYRCNLVVPIAPLLIDDPEGKKMRGFLIIDSIKEQAFRPDIDSKILKGIADGLCSVVDLFHDLIKFGELN